MVEKIFFNGDILTMEDSLYADAIFIKDGIIKKVGTKDEVLKFKNDNTDLIDLNGKTLMPSFIDSHSHITAVANTLSLVHLSNSKSFEDLVTILKNYKEENNLNDTDWIIGFGYDNNSLKEKINPTKEILDKVSTTNPIVITHISGHMGVLNSTALKEIGISKATKNPEGGKIGRVGTSNEPNGYVEETAFVNASSKIPAPSLNNLIKLLKKTQNIYLSYGITTAQDGLVKDESFALLKNISDNEDLDIDVVGYVDLKNCKHIVDDNKQYVKNYVNRFKIGGFKIFLDGSPQGRTAWMTKPYLNGYKDYCGYPVYQDNEIKDFIKTSLDYNIQLLSHCNGDAAANQLITSFKSVLSKNPNSKEIKPVMIHAQLLRKNQIASLKNINMIPSFFVAHTYYWGDVHIKNFGEERAFNISPAKTALEDGVLYTFHQDSPVIMPNMLETVWCAVNRVSKNGVIIGEDQRISPLAALKAVTINAAYQYSEEYKKGSLKDGKLADLIILDNNPLKVDPMEIKNIKILETIKEGKTLYKL